MATVSMRLPQGIHMAVKELAENVSVDISDIAAFLLVVGLSYARHDFSEGTKALLQADALEAQAGVLRIYAGTRGNKAGEKDWKNFEDVMNRLVQVAQFKGGD